MEEDKIKKKLRIKNISTISFASISGTVISGLFWLYLADLLGAENYGEIGYLLAIGAISSVVAMWGSEKAIIVYTAKGIPIQSSIYFISIFPEESGESLVAIIYSKGKPIAVQTCRSKSGPGGAVNDTLHWSQDYQKCLAEHTISSGRCG